MTVAPVRSSGDVHRMPAVRTAEWRVGLRANPHLADHGVRGMVLLPGASYIETAMRLYRERGGGDRGAVRNATFREPVVLGPDDRHIAIEMREGDGGAWAFTFHDASAQGAPILASMTVVRAPDVSRAGTPTRPPKPEAFERRPDTIALGAPALYAQLRANGNEYGPAFRNLREAWRAGNEALGLMLVPAGPPDEVPAYLLDSLVQVLGVATMGCGATFVLRSIERADIVPSRFCGAVWVHGNVSPAAEGGAFTGTVRAFDAAGRECATLTGVAFACSDMAAGNALAATGRERVPIPVRVSANFTAEPLEDTLRFWGDRFGIAVAPAFAPYNQVIQQLLDPASGLRQTTDGVNVVLLSLEEWAVAGPRRLIRPDRARAERCLAGHARRALPNGLEVAHAHAYETDYLFHEIFENEVYLRQGVVLPDAAVVVDIGANIGMFSVFVLSRCPNARVIAVEPGPDVYALLRANCEAYGPRAVAVNAGVAGAPGTAAFTSYAGSTVFSGFHADATRDRAAVETIVRRTLAHATAATGESLDEHVATLTAGRFEPTTRTCAMTTVSAIMRDHGLEKIDLLKVDAEGCEWEILDSIRDDEWPRIEQVVVEVHDASGDSVARIGRLLESRGFHCLMDREVLLAGSGLVNMHAMRRAAATSGTAGGHPGARAGGAARSWRAADGLRETVGQFCDALEAAAAGDAATPTVVGICPRTPAARSDAVLGAALDDAERAVRARAASLHGVDVVDLADLHVPDDELFDAHGRDLGHVPYTSLGYAAVGTEVFRAALRHIVPGRKVLVLDCDDTLWGGVCAEDGAAGVALGGRHRALQRFAVEQVRDGTLLCLCSKNEECDVWAVFDGRDDMVLAREQVTAWRINWQDKAENVVALAEELGVGVDSVVVIDDNPLECADLRRRCPEVLTLRFPSADEPVEPFLSQLWALDHGAVTREDAVRTQLYREGASRERFRRQTASLREFVDGLGLQVDVADATDDQVARLAQLTMRTNQFNTTTVRRREPEVRRWLARDGATCLSVRVADRFGDYGLTGAVFCKPVAGRFAVDGFMLSCRVLGRGVEHRVLAEVGRRALATGAKLVDVAFRPSERNTPMRAFLAALDGEYTEGRGFTFGAARLAELRYDPDTRPANSRDGSVARSAAGQPAPARSPSGRSAITAALQAVAERLNDPRRVLDAIEEYRRHGEAPDDGTSRASAGTLEVALLRIWQRVLARTRIGVNDNFFDAGGTSLRAVQVCALIRKELGPAVSLVTLFECPTVALLAARLRAPSTAEDADVPASSPDQAAARGQRRRQALRRKVS